MKKMFLALSLLLASGVFTSAQSDDYKKGEVFLGYSNGQVDVGDINGVFTDRTTFNGFNASGVYNVSRYFGIKGDISGTYKKDDFNVTFPGTPSTIISGRSTSSLYNFLAGVQVKDNASGGRLKPFAHALVGAGHARVEVKDITCTPSTTCPPTQFPTTQRETGLAGAFGGGLDVRLNDRIDLRLIQADYNPIKFDDSTTHNFRFGFGIVIK
jgi:hypothetical protein